VVLISTWIVMYLYRHCLALFRGRLYSDAIFLAIRLQFLMP
jgi:hypothetical protein